MLHEIFHAMYESKEVSLYWVVHTVTEMHGKVLNIVAILNSDVYESTRPVVEVSSM